MHKQIATAVFIVAAFLIGLGPEFALEHRSLFGQSSEQSPPAATLSPASQALLEGLLAEQIDPAIRLKQAQALLLDEQTHAALLEILNANNQTEIKLAICQALGRFSNGYYFHPHHQDLSPFVDPMIRLLGSDNAELARAAAKALASFYNPDLACRLADIIGNSEFPVSTRLAAVQALQQMPGKTPVTELGEYLTSSEPDVQNAVAAALQAMLALEQPIDAAYYGDILLPIIRDMNEQTFLTLQWAAKKDQLLDAVRDLQRKNVQLTQWQQRYLKAQMTVYDSIASLADKLNFIKPLLQTDQDAVVRLWAMERIQTLCSIAATPQPENIIGLLVDQLMPLINDPNPQVRRQTALALQKLVDQTARSSEIADRLLEQLSIETTTETQIALLEALGAFAYPGALETALKFTGAEDAALVAQAIATTGRIVEALPAPLNNGEFTRIVEMLTDCYARRHTADAVRKEIIRTIRTLAMVEAYRPLAAGPFRPVLESALTDSDGNVRSWAVRAMTALYREQSLPLFMAVDPPMLNDSEQMVCYAVNDALEKYGSAEHLQPLWQRLQRETNADVAKSLNRAFLSIVRDRLTIAEIVAWMKEHPLPDENGVSNNGSAASLQTLWDGTARVLWTKIVQADAENTPVALDHRLFALDQLVAASLRSRQYAEVVSWYQKKRERPELTDNDREQIDLTLLDLALKFPNQSPLTEAALPILENRLSGSKADQTHDTITQFYEPLDQSLPSLLQKAAIQLNLIAPVLDDLSPPRQQYWRQKRRRLTLALINEQERLLTSEEKDQPEITDLLPRLDARLSDYPVDGPVTARLEKIRQFRQLLQQTLYPESQESAG